MTFMQARTANEVLKAQERRLRLQQMKGELVDRAKAVAQVFRLAREERDAWVNWPARVAATRSNIKPKRCTASRPGRRERRRQCLRRGRSPGRRRRRRLGARVRLSKLRLRHRFVAFTHSPAMADVSTPGSAQAQVPLDVPRRLPRRGA
jgi:hypothetical protein